MANGSKGQMAASLPPPAGNSGVTGNITTAVQLAALQATEDGVVITDRDGIILWVNEAFTRMCGYSSDELVGNNPSLLRSDKHDREFFNELWSTILAGKVWRAEVFNRHKDGTIYPEEESITPLFNEDGECTHFIAIKRDISQRKRDEYAQEQLKKALLARSAVNAALTHAKDEQQLLTEVCRVITDVAGYVMAWVGFSDSELGQTHVAVARDGMLEAYREMIQLAWEHKERELGIASRTLRNGQPCVVLDIENDVRCHMWQSQALKHGFKSAISLPLKNEEGVFGVLLIYSGMADAFDNEEFDLLEQMAADLSFGIETIRHRKEKAHIQQQLQQAQKMEAIGHLTSGIAHDFNNMLASILGFAELSLEEVEAKEVPLLHSYLNQIYYSGGRARDLVRQLLSFSRSNEFSLVPTDLYSIVKTTKGILYPMLPPRITVNIKVERDLPMVLSDPVQVQQILLNLCINARDAIEGEGAITIDVHQAEIEGMECSSCHKSFSGSMVALSVEDNGTGISAEVQKRIFDPFFTTKEVGKGSGMGLPMVHGIVHDHGGHLCVTSEPGKGSRMSVYFQPSTNQTEGGEGQTDTLQAIVLKQLSGSVLIVDDEISVGAFIGELLKSYGCNVVVESGGQSGYERFLLSPDEFDLVILDRRMPGMTGSELAHAILQGRPDMPIIMCTASEDEQEREEAWMSGVYAHLQKPIDTKTLLISVAEMLECKQESES